LLQLREDWVPESHYNCGEWQPIEREFVVALLRCFLQIETLQSEVDREGAVIFSRLGTPRVNPKAIVLERMIRRSVSLSRRCEEIARRYDV